MFTYARGVRLEPATVPARFRGFLCPGRKSRPRKPDMSTLAPITAINESLRQTKTNQKPAGHADLQAWSLTPLSYEKL